MTGQPGAEHQLFRLPDTIITLIANLSGSNGVLRDPYIPFQCRKGVPEYQQHRREWMYAVGLCLKTHNKEIVRARWLTDGWFVDWQQASSPMPTTLAPSRYLPPSSIGRGLSNPVDLSLSLSQEDKDSDDGRSYFTSSSTTTNNSVIKSEEISDCQEDIKDESLISQRSLVQTTSPFHPEQPAVVSVVSSSMHRMHLDPHSLDPDHYRYIRVDCPSSLQLRRIPAIRPRHHTSSPYPRPKAKRGLPIELPRSGGRPLKDQSQSFRDAMSRPRNGHTSRPPSWSSRGSFEEDSQMQECAVAPEANFPSKSTLVNNFVDPETGSDTLFVGDDIVLDNPDDQDVNMAVDEDEIETSSASESDDSADLELRPRIVPQASTQNGPKINLPKPLDVLASINLTTIQDLLEDEPSPVVAASRGDKAHVLPTHKPPSMAKVTTSGTSEVRNSATQKATPADPKEKPISKQQRKLPKVSINYSVGEVVQLPKPGYARARRLLAPTNRPLIHVSMPGDVQFVDGSTRLRIEQWSLPISARRSAASQGAIYNVSDACLLDQATAVLVHGSGPHPASIIYIPQSEEERPHRHTLSHSAVPILAAQDRDILGSVCAVNARQFVTGGMDRQVLLWTLSKARPDPEVTVKALPVKHATSVKALAYSSSRKWLISGASSRLAILDMTTTAEVVTSSRQKWASSGIYNLHVHDQDNNLLLLETGDLDKQARIYDLRTVQAGASPAALLGSTEKICIPQFWRGDWEKSLVVRPSHENTVKVWDIRRPNEPVSTHRLKHTVTHTIFIDGGRTIAATGEHFITFIDA